MSLNRCWPLGLLGLAAACFVAGTASAQLTYVTARPTPSGAGANSDGTYHEFTSSGGSIVLGDSSAKSSATGAPARSGSRAYLSSTPLANPAAGFSLSPSLPNPGGIYLLEYTFNAAAGNVNTNLVLAVSSTNSSLSFTTTDKFQASFGNSTWQTIGYLTNAAGSSKPWLDFRYLSGYVTDQKRLNVDCFRFTCLTPIILAQPASRTNNAGTTATFSVSASGTGTLSYRWRKEDVALADGGNVSGAATATLSLSNVLKPDEGGYRVVVTNQYGSVTSAVAALTVIDPQITGQPLSQLKYVGQSATFSVTAVGTPLLSYQWWKDGETLAQAAESSLTLTNLQLSNAGSYFVVVSNQFDCVTSSVASLFIRVPSTKGYETTILGLNPLAYYRLDETNGTTAFDYSGGFDGTYQAAAVMGGPGVQDPPFGGFETNNTAVQTIGSLTNSWVSAPFGSLSTNAVTFTAWIRPDGLQSNWCGLVMTRGGGVAGGLGYNDQQMLAYTWNNDSTWTFNSGLVIPTNQWSFVAMVIEPNKAIVYLNGLLSATNAIRHTMDVFGNNWRIGEDAWGDAWGDLSRTFNGVIDEVAIFAHSLTPAQVQEIYDAAKVPPMIVLQPEAPTRPIYEGMTVSFQVTAVGSLPLAYQWTKNETNLVAETSTALVLSSFLPDDSGNYAVVVTNDYGAVTSSVVALSVHTGGPPVHYVDLSSTNPVPPYTNWATAALTIQDAVDVAVAWDEILVADGTYATGGRAVGSSILANRVVVDKPLALRSVNGPEFTVIQGYQVPGSVFGMEAIRCVYLANDASLSGFTVTNGATLDWDFMYDLEVCGGGVWCESASAIVSNCVLSGNAALYYGGGAFGGTLHNCTLTGNSAESGGGVYDGEVSNSVLTSNSATFIGGGAAYSTLNDCTLTGNSASYYGGGAYDSTLNNCALTGNSAAYTGGGASYSTLNNCSLSSNSADGGAGADNSTLNNCSITGNQASYGGGALDSILRNCTLTGNSAARDGGGSYGGTLHNCILYYNTALVFTNFRGGTLHYCCTAPLPASGTSNITVEPLLTDLAHLSAASPCRGAGSAIYASGVDIDGDAWASPPSIGCDEFCTGAITGPLTVALSADYTNAAVGEALCFTGQILGHATASLWDFGDGTVVSNCPYASYAWVAAGDWPVVLWACNDSYPDGVSATVSVRVVMVTPGTGTGLTGDYYSNRMDFAGVPALSRVDPMVNFDWSEGAPSPLISADKFSVRWSGYVQPFYSQTYTFYASTDDGVRLWVNGQRIIDAWWDQPATEWSGTIALNENQKYPIIVEYYENGGYASAVLSWSSASQPKRVVPQNQLYAAASSQPLLGCAGINNGTNLVLTWGGSYGLQTATNVAGPYNDLSGSTSPYTNNLAGPPRFFRLTSR